MMHFKLPIECLNSWNVNIILWTPLLSKSLQDVEAEALPFLPLLLDVEHQGHQLVALALLALHKVIDELPGHLLAENCRVLRVATAGGKEGWEENGLQLGLREELEGQVGQLLEHRWLRTALHYRLVFWVVRSEVAHQLDHLVEQAGLAVVMAVVEQVGCNVPEL